MSLEPYIQKLRFFIVKINGVNVQNATENEIFQTFLNMQNKLVNIEVKCQLKRNEEKVFVENKNIKNDDKECLKEILPLDSTQHESIILENTAKHQETYQLSTTKSYFILDIGSQKNLKLQESASEPIKNTRVVNKSVQTEISLISPNSICCHTDGVAENKLFEQCLIPEIAVEEVSLYKSKSSESLGITLCCNNDVMEITEDNSTHVEDGVREVEPNNLTESCENASSFVDNVNNAYTECIGGVGNNSVEFNYSDVFINGIKAGSIAALDKRLRFGDQILQINGKNIKSRDEANQLIGCAKKIITLLVSRDICGNEMLLDENTNFTKKFKKSVEDNKSSRTFRESELENENVIDVAIDTDYDNEDSLNVVKDMEYSHEKAYANLARSLDKDLFLDSPKRLITSLEKNTSKNHSSGNTFYEKKNNNLLKINACKVHPFYNMNCISNHTSSINAHDDIEHIYETIPEDTESDPLYCSPYQCHNYRIIDNEQTSEERNDLQQFQKRRVAQWLGISKDFSSTLISADKKLNYSRQPDVSREINVRMVDEHENSSSAYNTGGSNGSVNLLVNNTTFSTGNTSLMKQDIFCHMYPKNLNRRCGQVSSLLHKKISFKNGEQCKNLIGYGQQDSKYLLTSLTNPACSFFTAPNLSQYHFVSSQEVRDDNNQKQIHIHPSTQSQKCVQQQQKQSMQWKVKRRPDGSRYIVRRPLLSSVVMNNRFLKERIQSNNLCCTKNTDLECVSKIPSKSGRTKKYSKNNYFQELDENKTTCTMNPLTVTHTEMHQEKQQRFLTNNKQLQNL